MDVTDNDLEGKFVPLLTFGKLIGAYPTKTKFDRFTWIIPLLLATVAAADLVGVTILSHKTSRTATEIAKDFGVPGFYSLGAFLYFHLRRNVHELQEIFAKWRQLEIIVVDVKLKGFVSIASFCILTSAILENATFHFKLFPVFETLEPVNASSLEVFYTRSHGHLAIYVPYNPLLTILLFLTNKWALYMWNFADVLIAVTSRALYFRYNAILKFPDSVVWDNVWFEFIQLYDITQLIKHFLSPFIFGCYTMNMYAICMQLHMWLTPAESSHYLHTLYLAWSFVHLLARVLLVSICAAKVNEEICLFARKVQYCPQNFYSMDIERLELCTSVAKRELGLTGLGCFFITKPFILSLFSFAFTFEIFLLQSDAIILGLN